MEKRGSFSEELVSFASIHNREEVREQAELYTGLIKGLEVRRQNKERLSADKARLEKELAAARESWEKALEKGGFAGPEAYQEAVLEETDRKNLSEAIARYRLELGAAAELCSHMEEELKGKEETDTAPFLDKRNSLLEEKKGRSMRTRWSIGASDAPAPMAFLRKRKRTWKRRRRPTEL